MHVRPPARREHVRVGIDVPLEAYKRKSTANRAGVGREFGLGQDGRPCRLLTVSMHGSVCDKGCACRARGLLAELGHVADLEIGVEL